MLLIGLVVIGGLAFDWGLYSRFVGLLGQHYSSNDGYLSFLYPRALVTVSSLILMGNSIRKGGTDSVALTIGSVLFLGSNFYAVYRFYRGDNIGE